jgi:hypothetical protein
VHCNAWEAGSGTPSASQVKASAYPTYGYADIPMNVTVTGLKALTAYDVYCYT